MEVGAAFTSGQSSFNNIDRGNRLAVATEYNLFPYSLSAEKALTFGYYVGINQFRYDQVTIFGLEEETLGNHGAFADFDFEQPWGNLSVGLYSAVMMDDPSLYRVTLDGYLRYRLARGLSVDSGAKVRWLKIKSIWQIPMHRRQIFSWDHQR